MDFKERYGPVALIAGASAGLGAAYSHALAERGLDLVMVARNKVQLETTADQISRKYKVRVIPIACDLGLPEAVDHIRNASSNLAVRCLVYNAAASCIGGFLDTPLADQLRIAEVNMISQLKLIHGFARPMIEAGRGGVILMSSIAGFQGSGYLAAYAASKAFNRILAESLWFEWKSKGVDVIACSAGATGTPNYFNTQPRKTGMPSIKPQLPEKVVKECLAKIGKTPSFVSGASNKIASFLMQHVFSRKMAINLIGNTTKKMYGLSD